CSAQGQTVIYNLLWQLWTEISVQWLGANWGTMLGAACIIIRSGDSESRMIAAKRLWTILATKSLYLVWKLRCERVIQNDRKDLTFATLNQRLMLDQKATATYLGKRALKPGMVETTWLPVLEHNRDLLPNWVGNGKVLVGIKRGR
ncbi:hypothetical protein BC628DRAFT_1325927, partial [Trametes gibbosa]